MKTLSILCGFLFAVTLLFANPKSGSSIKKEKPTGTATITLTSIKQALPTDGYHAVFTSSTGHRYTAGFLTNGGTTTTQIPEGIYNVEIVPTGGPGTNHEFHGVDCNTVYNGSGVQIAWQMNFSCGSGSLSIVQ